MISALLVGFSASAIYAPGVVLPAANITECILDKCPQQAKACLDE
jgi:hypothetical protein